MRWWRRFRGGHWERWATDVPVAEAWVPMDECTLVRPLGKGKPMPSVRPVGGYESPTCEDWPSGGWLARKLRLARLANLRIDPTIKVDPAALAGLKVPRR